MNTVAKIIFFSMQVADGGRTFSKSLDEGIGFMTTAIDKTNQRSPATRKQVM